MFREHLPPPPPPPAAKNAACFSALFVLEPESGGPSVPGEAASSAGLICPSACVSFVTEAVYQHSEVQPDLRRCFGCSTKTLMLICARAGGRARARACD